MRIDITQDMFINNAWCGTFKIHQNVAANEIVQTVDLRKYNIDELKIDYIIADPDLLIPLQKGDYIIYHPDYTTDEYPIKQGDSEKLTQVVFGSIFYYSGSEPVVFNNYEFNYYLEMIYVKNPIFIGLSIALFVWFIWLIVFVAVALNMKKAHKRFKQDEHIIRQSIGVFTRFFEAKDTYTNGHSQRVADYSKLIAEKMNLTEGEVRKIYYIALMHDCGKCYIPDEILKKPGRPTDEEFEIIRSKLTFFG